MEKILAVVTDLMFSVKVLDAGKAAGRAVEFVKSMDEALRKAGERPALVVLDLNCREVDTVELVRRLKADPELRGIRTLGFISHVQEGRRREAVEAGCDRVVARSVFSDRAVELMGS